MKIKNLFFFSCLILLFSCNKEDQIVAPNPIEKDTGITLTNLQVGQTSTYIRYTTTCENEESDFQYTGDSLVVTVIEKDGQLYLEERITDGSPMLQDDGVEQIFTHIVHGDGQRIMIPERGTSQLFYFFGNDTLPVLAEVNVDLKQNGCQLFLNENPFIGNEIGKIEQFKVGDIIQTDKRSVSCIPMFTIDAYLIYDNRRLYQSHTIHFETFWDEVLSDVIIGWVLVE